MKLKYEIIVEAKPLPRSVRFSRFGSYNTKRVRDWMNLVRDISNIHIKLKKFTAEQGVPVKVDLTFYLPIAKGTSKKKIAELTDKPHIKTPDVDNLEKPIKDGLTEAGMWYDDCQVHELKLKKILLSPRRRSSHNQGLLVIIKSLIQY